MSIFQKDCPQCAAPNPVQADRCNCGYYFEAAEATGKRAATEVALQEETLYEDYLAARVVQAEATVEVARAEAGSDRANTYKAAQVLVAEQALSAARAELRAQTERTAHLKRISYRSVRRVVPEPKKPAIAKPLAPIAKPPAPVIKPRLVPPAIINAATVKPPSKADSAPVAKPAETPAPRPIQAKKPGTKFRARQAARAEAAVRAARAPAPQPPPTRIVPATAPAPTIARPAAPAKVVTATKECPNCTARVAGAAEHCRCGFSFPATAREMASLSLDADALAILANDTTFGSPHR